MPLIRVGRHAVDVNNIARMLDQGDSVILVYKDRDGDRDEFTGADAVAARDLIQSLPTHIPPARYRVECTDDETGYAADLAGDPDAGERRG